MEGVVSLLQATVEAARGGDVEAIGWVAVGCLGGLVLAVAIVQSFLLPLVASPAKGAEEYDDEIDDSSPKLPPMYAEGAPLVGNLLSFIRDPVAVCTRAHQKYGELFTLPMLHKRLTFCVGPEAHEIFCRGSDEELDQAEVYKFSVPVFGRGVVFDAPLVKRYQQFRWLSQGLRADKLKSYVPQMVMEAETYFKDFPESGEFDLYEKLSELIIMTSSRCLLGREVRESMFGRLCSIIHDLDQGMQPISVFAPYLPTPAHRARDAAHREIKAVFHKVIAQRRAAGAEAAEPDMLQTFIDGSYRDGTNLTDDEITGLLIAGLFAGQHTSSITSSWTGLRLLRNEKELAKVLAEQESLKAEFGDAISFESLSKMNALHNCMKETLRMYPPLIFLIRSVAKELRFKDMVIPKGDLLFLSPVVSGRDGSVFANPDEWDPSRFEPARAEDKKAPFAYVGFGGGRHGCMGEQFAYLQVKTIWSVLLREFELECVGPLQTPVMDALVVGPSPPCTVRFRRRRPSAPVNT